MKWKRKLTKGDAITIRELHEYKMSRIAEIDEEIQKLKEEKAKLNKNLSCKQLAFKFDISEAQVSKITRYLSW